ncbi:hypothetical protein [Nannocystis punicea]|uniref:NADH:ubiquinone oxidoreductase subunit 5 (Chain L)/Multisubunit Na+/H+ antiporter, MnhA subunit n=1 Tax=Nannocystis punicea TaxID=2995304 RepID=A0ABY7HH75_9BACT|nr:hypothetical protein [Nannocystis poenicansa]WAS98425.1 hypothetical protein O0S08_19970 [Nannocystis poenicansa]
MGALAATLVPAAVGLALLGLVGPLERRWGRAAAGAAAARAALVAAVLAALVLWQAIQRDQLEHRFEWIRVGRTTTIDWIVQLDGLGLALGVVALAALVLGVVADLAFGTAAGGRPGARMPLVAGGALVLASGGTLAQLAIGVGLIVLALRAWPSDHVSSDMPDRTWLLGLIGTGLALAGLAWLAAAGDLDLMRLERAAFGQERSELVRGRIGGPLFGLPPGAVATVAAGAAALAWALAWPRLLARAWAEGPGPALVATCVAGPALGVVLLRTHVALAMAPTALAMLAAAAAGAAAWAGSQAARARTSARALTAGTTATLAIAAATIAIGEPVAATQLLIAGGLAWAAPIAGLSAPRRLRAGIFAVAAIGWVAALGAAVAALWNDLSAWSSGINVLATALALVAVGGVAGGIRRVLADRTDAPGWPRPEAPPLLLGVGGVLALGAVAAGLWPLGPQIWPLFVAGRMFEGDYALGPRPGALLLGPAVGAGLVAVAAIVGLVLAPRIQPAPARSRSRAAGAAGPTIPRLLRLGERLVGRLTLWPGDERVTVAPGRFDVRGPLLLATAGAVAILGSVFCNPDVVVLGPTRVHPVDLGGLDAAMVGARRAATEAPKESVRAPQASLEGQGEDIGRAPLGGPGAAQAGGTDMPEGAGAPGAAGQPEAGGTDMPEGAGAPEAAGQPATGAGGMDMLEGAGAPEAAGQPATGAGGMDMLEGAGSQRPGGTDMLPGAASSAGSEPAGGRP